MTCKAQPARVPWYVSVPTFVTILLADSAPGTQASVGSLRCVDLPQDVVQMVPSAWTTFLDIYVGHTS